MDLAGIDAEMASLDLAYRRVATEPVDVTDPDALTNLGATVAAALAALGVDDRAEAVLRAVVQRYATGDESDRVALRGMFGRYPSFRWAAHLPRHWAGAAEFRARLIHLSARDQGDDARDEILGLQDLCDRAVQDGIDVDPILDEVAALSSAVDRYGMGSTRDIIRRQRPGR
ncbi:hypothetical protein E0H26_22895 [Micromonospora zingiberis]|uniref:Uncharacterized protein n=1 Tax=Micromonospora zingiberis TaxID=2053011 RepID=A0A4R0GBJ0_9ACTN|nr:hypothetical protein [Micromonospora zingiberis]TCB93392.1 hypothetical protein E0H26_22895 [Micromonospora zingiberis]